MVEGEDLSVHIARGAIPLAEALPIARQIAEVLEGLRASKALTPSWRSLQARLGRRVESADVCVVAGWAEGVRRRWRE